jgi:hypothetical protein
MNLLPIDRRVEFNSGDNQHAKCFPRTDPLGYAICRVVISDRQRLNTANCRKLDQLRWAKQTV